MLGGKIRNETEKQKNHRSNRQNTTAVHMYRVVSG